MKTKIKNKIIIFCISLILGGLFVFSASAAIPNEITYQAKIRDSEGVPLNGTYDMKFVIWNTASGGSAGTNDVWSETWDGNNGSSEVTVNSGVYTIELNDVCQNWVDPSATNCDYNSSGVTWDGDFYLEVQLDPGEDGTFEEVFSPRKHITATPMALNALSAESVESVGSGSADGQMAFWDTSTSQWVNTETGELVWDDTNKLLGINQTTPTAYLSIGDSATTAPINVTERSTAPSAPSAGDVYLDDGANTASGNPGWRRYTGSAWEDVSAGAGGGGGTPGDDNTAIQFNDSGAFGGDDTTFAWDNTNKRLAVGLAASSLTSRVTIEGEGATSATSALSVIDSGSTSLLHVRDDGNVGIGTDTPAYVLDVQKAISDDYLASFYNSSTGDDAQGLFIRNDGGSEILTLNADGANIVTISEVQSTFNNPTQFAASGDVSIANDLDFTNDTAAFINFQGPGYIQTTSTFENLDLTLSAAEDGTVVIDDTLDVVGRLNAEDGIATLVKSGTVTDSDFAETANDGLMAIDSSNGRIYFRYDSGSGSGWHYVNQTAGFQIPNYETGPQESLDERALREQKNALPFDSSAHPEYLTQKMVEGEFLIPYVDEYLSDGAVHGLYARFADVKTLMFDEEQTKLEDLTLQSEDTLASISTLQTGTDERFASIDINLGELENSLTDLQMTSSESVERLDGLETELAQIDEQLEVLGLANGGAGAELLASSLQFMEQAFNPDYDDEGTLESLTVYEELNLEGDLKARAVELTGLSVKNEQEEAKIIGQEKIVVAEEDENGDPVEELGKNGKSVIIETGAVTESCKIFTSFGADPGSTSWVEKIEEDDEYTGFVIKLKDPVEEEVAVNWWIVEESL